MKLLVLADERPRADPAEMAVQNGVEAVVTLGDLRSPWLASLATLDGIPRFGVHGNHDEPDDLVAGGVRDLHLARTEVGGWSFAGFEGCVRYKPGPFQYTQAEATTLVASLAPADVLVTHCPPLGVNDEPDDPALAGFAALRVWVERVQPRYLLHGHTTPDPRRRVHRLGSTQVVWVRGARVIELA